MLSVLRQRDFALLWLGGLISIAGDWVLYAALPFFVYERTGSTIATAGMIAAELGPSVLLGTVAGVFVDRWDRKRVLIVGNGLQAAAVSLLLLVPHGWLGLVYLVAIAQSAVAAFTVPGESALLPSLVGEGDLLVANALNVLNNRMARLIGVPVGGALLGYLGIEPVVLVDCATFLAAALLIAPIVSPQHVRREAAEESTSDVARSAWSTFWREWRDGLGLVRSDRTIAVLFFVLGLMTYGGTMLDPLTVAWVRDVLDAGPQIFSWMLTIHAASGIVGSFFVGRHGARLTSAHLMGWSSILAGGVLVVKYNVPVVPLALGLSVVNGFTSVASSVGVETLVQRTVPDALRGRVFGALGASSAFLSLAGAATGGILAEIVGIVPMLDVAAGLTALAGVVVIRAFPAHPRARSATLVVD